MIGWRSSSFITQPRFLFNAVKIAVSVVLDCQFFYFTFHENLNHPSNKSSMFWMPMLYTVLTEELLWKWCVLPKDAIQRPK